MSDFINIGDNGIIIVTTTTGFGEGGFGEGPFGGGVQVATISAVTVWTNIATP